MSEVVANPLLIEIVDETGDLTTGVIAYYGPHRCALVDGRVLLPGAFHEPTQEQLDSIRRHVQRLRERNQWR